ncbi:MAG TPA: ABC transporter ATP-binding protein [Rubrobacter sp.]|nr:ABC transporter ATP-binding protein [Rubrobacter sp.]
MMQRILRCQLVETLSRIWPYLKPDWRRLLLVAAVMLGLTLVEVSVPILVGIFIDSLLSELGGRQPATAPLLDNRTIIALLAVGALLRGYLLYQQRSISGRIGQRVAARMRDAVWVHLQEVPLDYTRRRGPGRLLVRFISDTRAVQRLVSQGMVQLIQDVLFVIGAITVLTYLNFLVGLSTTLLLPLIVLVFWRINPRVQQASRDTRNRRTRLSGYLNARLTGLAVVKIHGRQREEAKHVRKLNRNVASRGARLAAAGGQLQGASAATVALVTTLTLALAAEEVAAGRLSAGYLVTSYALIGLLAPVVQRITIVNRTLQEAQISVERLAQTLAEEPESPREEELPEVEVSEGLVSVEGVSFSYPDGTLALDDVSLTARRGELVALVGPNGAGKSTLLELLPRFRHPSNGHIVIDGQDIADVSLESLRSKIGFVTQDTPLFDGTITENVTYGVRGDASEEQIQQAARLAGVDELVASLPDGWETKVREGRRMLSRGQRQRVVLARALAADPSIILLDEVGSGLDIETQRTLSEELRVLAEHKTVIVATHSMPTMLMADQVYRLDRGRIVEEGRDVMLTRLEGT